MDLISLLGYSKDSPYAGNPYLDIHTPDGLIDMSNTPIDLVGIDNKGNKKKMKAGRKNPYQFDGDMVREIPSGNIYRKGGLTKNDIFKIFFNDDEDDIKEEPAKKVENTAPSSEEVSPEDTEQDDLAMEQAMMYDNPGDAGFGNPYNGSSRTSNALGSYGPQYQNLDENVTMATQELLEKFPNLRLTSGKRNWGDKDAHPKGRAVDLSYDKDAFNYYQNVLVPKYKFNKALDPDHGTGKHIHLGYY